MSVQQRAQITTTIAEAYVRDFAECIEEMQQVKPKIPTSAMSPYVGASQFSSQERINWKLSFPNSERWKNSKTTTFSWRRLPFHDEADLAGNTEGNLFFSFHQPRKNAHTHEMLASELPIPHAVSPKADDHAFDEDDFTPVFATFRKKDFVAKLEWKDIDYHVGKKHIIKSVSGEANPGEVVAIMGPSGGGKTTLLNLLAGRIQPGGNKKLSGTITMNGEQVKPLSFRKKVAYVTQEDALFATATVRESLEFSCRLRLPACTPREDRKRIVDDIIASLGLTKCEDTMIGSEMVRGLSGGEKKRCAIGVELVSNPSILFLDEPTSGLDSHSAMNVVKILRGIARIGATVLCSIHQPSSEVFALFDTLILLGAGTVVYQGPVADIDGPFNAMGYYFPPRSNVADYALLLVQTKPLDKLPNNSKNENRIARPAWVDDNDVEAATTAATDTKRSFHVFKRKEGSKPGLMVQAWWLMIRECKSIYRDTAGLFGRFGITIFLHVLFAILFLGAGDMSRSNYTLQSHFGAAVQLIISALFGAAQPALLLFPMERVIFIREKATGTYGTAPYLFAKLLVELPIAYLVSLVSLLITYWAIALNGNFFFWSLCLWGLSLAATSTAMVIGSLVTTAKSAQEFAPLVLVPQILFLGLFIRLDQMPVWISWAQYLCSAKYGLNLATVVEFAPEIAPNEQVRKEWADFLDYNSISYDLTWLYALLLVILFAGFRLVALVALNEKAKQLG